MVVKALQHSRDLRLDQLSIVTRTPILHSDGSVLAAPGYDRATKSLYQPQTPLVLPAIPDRPTRQQALAAVMTLSEPFQDFPFETQESIANNLGLLLSILYRRLLNGLAPAAAISAPQPGYGKTLLMQTHFHIATGGFVTNNAVPGSEEEWGKQIMG